MSYSSDQRAIVIGKTGTTTGLRMFGFRCIEIDSMEEMTTVIETLENERSTIGMVLLTSDVTMTDRQWKKFANTGIPSVTIPIHADQKSVATNQMEQLIEKAVGMKLNFLTNEK